MFYINLNKLLYELDMDKHEINFTLRQVSSIDNPKNNSVIYINDKKYLKKIRNLSNCMIILPIDINGKFKENNYIFYSKNPRLDYAITVNKILELSSKKDQYIENAFGIVVGKNSKIGKNVKIHPNVYIDNEVTISDDCEIQSGVRIYRNVRIGEKTIIGANSTIGYHGFGVEIDDFGKTIKVPQLGGVIIGKECNISTNNNIHAGTIDPTILEDYVQTDSLVHIAHNCNIGKSTIITACAELSGSVTLGEKCYIGPNSSLINKIKLGDNCIVGIGAVVKKSFPENSIIAGNPSKNTYELREEKRLLHKLMKGIKNSEKNSK